jgi:hypothetical protein
MGKNVFWAPGGLLSTLSCLVEDFLPDFSILTRGFGPRGMLANPFSVFGGMMGKTNQGRLVQFLFDPALDGGEPLTCLGGRSVAER